VTTPDAHTVETAFGSLTLARSEHDPTGTLRAWSAADLLLLDAVAAVAPPPSARIAVVGDRFGVLTIALSHWPLASVVESIGARRSMARNAAASGRPLDAVSIATSIEDLSGRFDLIVWHIPRETVIIEHVAAQLGRLCHADAVVLTAGMDRQVPPRTTEILRSAGDVTVQRGQRKAHVVEIRSIPTAPDDPSPVHRFRREVFDGHEYVIETAPGVFGAQKTDLGTRLLIPFASTPVDGEMGLLVDLGCGSGILGLVASRSFPHAEIWLLDDDWPSVRSAANNITANVGAPAAGTVQARHSNVFEDVPDLHDIDVILCNPPFHHDGATDDEVAWRMLRDSHDRLRRGGELRMVGNRHLAYHAKLHRIFGAANVRTLAEHPKFVVLAAVRSR
jgi:23S rRNA (guanine1835-N2)-methyltransferase